VSPESTDTSEGLGRFARASARRCKELCFGLVDRQPRDPFSAFRPRRLGDAGSSTELTVELLGRLMALASLDSRIRLSLGRKPVVSLSLSIVVGSDAGGLGDEERGE
jgi:hypothetical protein